MSRVESPLRKALSGVQPVALWACAVLIAVFFAMLYTDSAIFGGVYVPQGNDSFYHARRMLDALGPRGFYELDMRLHAPDGRVIPWPWAYDYLIATLARVVIWLFPAADPVAVLFYIPVAFIAVNAALFLAAAAALRLSTEMRVVAMLCFALSPLTQLLHAFGMLDHHYIEHSFVLLHLWTGLMWFRNPAQLRWAVALGVTLGVAPAFHTGLFVLQIAPAACVLLLWLRGVEPPRRALVAFAVALLAATLLVLAPSSTFRAGYFEYGLLSWFHLYVAACTAACMLFIAWRRCSARQALGLAILAAILAVPGLQQLRSGAAFIAGDVSVLGEVFEAQSVYAQLTRTLGPRVTASLYSWLILLAPVLLIWLVYRLAKERAADQVFYAVAGVVGLLLLLAQFRFHYYGLFVLLTSGLLALDALRSRFAWHRGAVFAATLGAVLVAYQPPLRARLLQIPPPGIDPDYASSQPLYLRLAQECAADPGVVLANANDGNPILFHTDCGVITNNFILSPADDEHLRRAGTLFRMQPDAIRRAAPEVKYLLVRISDFAVLIDGQPRLLADNPVVAQLLLAAEPPPGYSVLDTVYYDVGADNPPAVYARLYKIAAAEPDAHD